MTFSSLEHTKKNTVVWTINFCVPLKTENHTGLEQNVNDDHILISF